MIGVEEEEEEKEGACALARAIVRQGRSFHPQVGMFAPVGETVRVCVSGLEEGGKRKWRTVEVWLNLAVVDSFTMNRSFSSSASADHALMVPIHLSVVMLDSPSTHSMRMFAPVRDVLGLSP